MADTYHIFLIHYSIGGDLDYNHVFSVVSNAVMTVGMQLSLFKVPISFSLDICPEVDMVVQFFFFSF